MPTEAQIIPQLILYPNDQPILPNLLEPLSDKLVRCIHDARTKREPCYAYAVDTETLHILYPYADQIARMDVNYVQGDSAALALWNEFVAIRSSGRHGRLLREGMLDAFVQITGIEVD